jgi:hypothetical protein
MSYEPEPELTPPGNPLPWTPEAMDFRPTPGRKLMFYWLVFSGGYALIFLVFPALLVYRTVRRRSGGSKLLLAAYVAVTLLPYLYVTIRHYLWYHLQGLRPPIGFTFLLDDPAGLGAARYVGKVLLLPVMGTIAALPGAAFFVALVSLSLRRRWARVLLLIALSVAAAVALAVVLLWVNARWMDPHRMDPTEGYSWEGWYSIWLLGAYAMGMLILLWLVLRTVFRLLRWAVRRLIPQAKPA